MLNHNTAITQDILLNLVYSVFEDYFCNHCLAGDKELTLVSLWLFLWSPPLGYEELRDLQHKNAP